MKRQATLNRSTSLAWTASRSCSLAVALEALDELKVVDLAQAVELSRSLSSELPTLEELAEPEMLEVRGSCQAPGCSTQRPPPIWTAGQQQASCSTAAATPPPA